MSFAVVAKVMLEEGCSAEQITAAVVALEAAAEREKMARRAAAAERQRRCRDRKRHTLSRDVTVTARDPFPPIKETSPTPPVENKPLISGEGAPAPLASRLPVDFEPSADDRAFGAAEGLSEPEIDRALSDLRLWAAETAGAKAVRSDWHATLRRFMRRDADAKRARNPPASLAVEPVASGVHIRIDSPQWRAWAAWWRKTKASAPPIDRDGGWRFPSEWPPPGPSELSC